ncbi:MAG: hypothetical protein NZ869_08030, partial [Thermoanaerobaculum sp.]|nr:hypothetical protein [Thermoanaerobaculum sp.]MDW7966990.1 helix-turn-helix domain-containing protein [Thermoanaerobaculum sp.]
LPPLRERLEDLPYLLAELVNQFAGQFGLGQMAVEPEVVQVLAAHSWPGNVRELEAVVVQSLLRCRPGERLAVHHLPSQLGLVRASPELPPLLPLEAAERDFLRGYFQRLLEAAGGNRTRAAKLAGISRPALLYRLRQLGLQEKLRS